MNHTAVLFAALFIMAATLFVCLPDQRQSGGAAAVRRLPYAAATVSPPIGDPCMVHLELAQKVESLQWERDRLIFELAVLKGRLAGQSNSDETPGTTGDEHPSSAWLICCPHRDEAAARESMVQDTLLQGFDHSCATFVVTRNARSKTVSGERQVICVEHESAASREPANMHDQVSGHSDRPPAAYLAKPPDGKAMSKVKFNR